MVSAIIVANNTIGVGETHLHHVVEALNSARVLDIILVHDESGKELARRSESLSAKAVQVDEPNEIAAITAGITACNQKDLHGIMLIPLDIRKITQGSIVNLLQKFWVLHKGIVVARMEGNQDIPIIGGSLFEEIRQSPTGETLEAFIARHDTNMVIVPIDEHGNIIRQNTSVAADPPTNGDI